MEKLIEHNLNLPSIWCKYYTNNKGQLHGLWTDYWGGNKPSREIKYFNNKKNGFETWYNVNGKIINRVLYFKGKLMEHYKLKENDIVIFNDDSDNIPYLVHTVNNDTISVILGLEEYPDVPMDSEILFTKITKLSGKELSKARKQIQKLM